MFLGNMKVRSRGFTSGFSQKEIPKPLPPEELESLVIQLGSGSKEVKNKIIMAHLGLTLQIIGRYVAHYPSKTDDLIGVAMVSVAESVDKFDTIKKDNNITGFIVTSLHGHLSNFTKEDKTVKISWRELQKQVAEYKETGVPNETRTYSLEHCLQSDNVSRSSRELVMEAITRYDIHEVDAELQEIIDKVHFTRFEYLVYTGLMNGEGEAEIAKRVGKSRQVVNVVKMAVRAKLEPYYSHLLERGYLELIWD